MKQFSLEEYLKNPSRKVVTRDGRPAEIKCTNYVSPSSAFCVIAEVYMKNVKMPFLFRETDGRFDRTKESGNDLFFAPEKHEGWVNLYPQGRLGGLYGSEEKAIQNAGGALIATVKIEWEE